MPQSPSLLSQDKTRDERDGRPTQELAGDQPQIWRATCPLPCGNYTLEPVRGQFAVEHLTVAEFSSHQFPTQCPR